MEINIWNRFQLNQSLHFNSFRVKWVAPESSTWRGKTEQGTPAYHYKPCSSVWRLKSCLKNTLIKIDIYFKPSSNYYSSPMKFSQISFLFLMKITVCIIHLTINHIILGNELNSSIANDLSTCVLAPWLRCSYLTAECTSHNLWGVHSRPGY